MTVEMDRPLVQEIEGEEELTEFGRACKQSAAIFKDKGFDEVAEDLMALAESCGVKKPGRKPGSKNVNKAGEPAETSGDAGAQDKEVDPPVAKAASGSNGAQGPKIKVPEVPAGKTPDPEDVKFSEVDG